MRGINIWSGSDDPLGAALTFPTELSKKKGALNSAYELGVCDKNGKLWIDAEAAYQHFKKFCKTEAQKLRLYIAIAKARFLQHRNILNAVTKRGGVAWINTCCHATGAKTERFKRWEGTGRRSLFIRCLRAAYALARYEQRRLAS